MKKTLLVGNGINQSFSGESWKSLIAKMSGNDHFSSNLPLPLQVVLATGDRVDVTLKRECKNMRGSVTVPEHQALLCDILDSGFEDIITTNYSYELEIAAIDNSEITNYALDKMRENSHKGNRAEVQYLIHTYNRVVHNDNSTRIWHIHGEARNPSGIVIGQYYYGNLLAKIKEYSDKQADRYIRNQLEIKSWIDAFILDDVYVLGFGFDVSEMDLWWLLERKNREKAEHGKVYFYCPEWEADKGELIPLLQGCGVTICGQDIKVDYKDYLSFYKAALQQIREKEPCRE